LINENPFGICILTPMMKRAHKLFMATQIVFVDTTASCDSQNHSITFMLTTCAVGAVPLCVLITQGQTQMEYEIVFQLLKNTMGEGCFGNKDPIVFMTDDSDAEHNALKKIWPSSNCKLCLFHVPQAVWRWLWNSKNKIKHEDRKDLMIEFQKVMYSETKTEAESSYNNCAFSSIGSVYPLWLKYVEDYWNRKERWCKAWRGVEMHGNHTNNFCEASVRLYKDEVLRRCKAYNTTSLVDFTVNDLERYYIRRLRMFANSRNPSAQLLLEKQIRKSLYVDDICKIKVITENLYMVPSSKDPNTYYDVNSTVGLCSCLDGRYGKFCKHQAAVFAYFKCGFPNSPKCTQDDRYQVACLALGDKVPCRDFYESLMPKNSSTASNNYGETLSESETVNNNTALICDTADICNSNTPSNASEAELDNLFNAFKTCHFKYGTSKSAVEKMTKRLHSVTSKGQWESFLHQGYLNRYKHGATIRVQPTSISRRREGVTKGSKRLPSGRPAKCEKAKQKRSRNLGKNITLNQPNAKSH